MMNVVCIEEKAFYALIEQVIERLKKEQFFTQDKWVIDKEAMRLLNIKSKSTLQKLRDEGKIRFSQPQKKTILYDRTSINDYLDKNAHNIFVIMAVFYQVFQQ